MIHLSIYASSNSLPELAFLFPLAVVISAKNPYNQITTKSPNSSWNHKNREKWSDLSPSEVEDAIGIADAQGDALVVDAIGGGDTLATASDPIRNYIFLSTFPYRMKRASRVLKTQKKSNIRQNIPIYSKISENIPKFRKISPKTSHKARKMERSDLRHQTNSTTTCFPPCRPDPR